MFLLLGKLFNTLGYLITTAFIFTLFKNSKYILTKEKHSKKDILFLSLFFTCLAILGTFIGINYKSSIVNTRNIGVIAGGLLAGPEVALITSFLAALHRYIFNFDMITSIPCSIGTILAGILSSFFFKKSTFSNKPCLGFICAFLVESISMLLILFLSPNYELAVDIVKTIYFPMILINGLGTYLIIFVINTVLEEKENEAGTQAKLALEIASKTLPYLKKGESLNEVCKVILNSIDAQVVAITDTNFIIGFYSKSNNFNPEDKKIKSGATKSVLATGKTIIFDKDGETTSLSYIDNSIKSCIITPLFTDEKVIGTLKIYFKNESHITNRKKFLALGLSQLISTQLELSKLEDLKSMARTAELKALQNQINPHFLFNALNTIASFVRFDPFKAREIIIDLSIYLRYNLENIEKFVPLTKELEQTNAYINIEKARFKNKFDVVYNIHPETKNLLIPSLIIQPLVENSIKHGILKQREFGIIKISSFFENSKPKIVIEDNGIGIDSKIIDSLESQIEKNIGLKNVHSRLKLLYGKGVTIVQLEKGTKISFYISN